MGAIFKKCRAAEELKWLQVIGQGCGRFSSSYRMEFGIWTWKRKEPGSISAVLSCPSPSKAMTSIESTTQSQISRELSFFEGPSRHIKLLIGNWRSLLADIKLDNDVGIVLKKFWDAAGKRCLHISAGVLHYWKIYLGMWYTSRLKWVFMKSSAQSSIPWLFRLRTLVLELYRLRYHQSPCQKSWRDRTKPHMNSIYPEWEFSWRNLEHYLWNHFMKTYLMMKAEHMCHASLAYCLFLDFEVVHHSNKSMFRLCMWQEQAVLNIWSRYPLLCINLHDSEVISCIV